MFGSRTGLDKTRSVFISKSSHEILFAHTVLKTCLSTEAMYPKNEERPHAHTLSSRLNTARIGTSIKASHVLPLCISAILAIYCCDGEPFYRQTETQMARSPLGDGV